MDSWKPEGLTPLVKWAKIATRADYAVIKPNRLSVCTIDGLDDSSVVRSERLHLTPDEFDAHRALINWLQCEAQGIEVLGLHEAAQNAWRVLKELLRIHNRDMEVLLQVTRAKIARESATDKEHAPLIGTSHAI